MPTHGHCLTRYAQSHDASRARHGHYTRDHGSARRAQNGIQIPAPPAESARQTRSSIPQDEDRPLRAWLLLARPRGLFKSERPRFKRGILGDETVAKCRTRPTSTGRAAFTRLERRRHLGVPDQKSCAAPNAASANSLPLTTKGAGPRRSYLPAYIGIVIPKDLIAPSNSRPNAAGLCPGRTTAIPGQSGGRSA